MNYPRLHPWLFFSITETLDSWFAPYQRIAPPISNFFREPNPYGIYPSLRFHPLFDPFNIWLPFGEVPFAVTLSKYEKLYLQLINVSTITLTGGTSQVTSSVEQHVVTDFGQQTILRRRRGGYSIFYYLMLNQIKSKI